MLEALEGAVEAFQELIERFPNFSIARFHLGVIYTRQGNTKRAEAQFQKLLLDGPEHVAAQFYSSNAR
jgi:TolA-binding protein